jgi:hypothetical protein
MDLLEAYTHAFKRLEAVDEYLRRYGMFNGEDMTQLNSGLPDPEQFVMVDLSD